MQETKQALTPDEMAEVMGKKSHETTFELTGEDAKTVEDLVTAPPTEPFYFYMVNVTIQKRSHDPRKKYLPRTVKGIVRTNAYSKIRSAVSKLLEKYLEADDAYIKNLDARKLETDFFIPEA